MTQLKVEDITQGVAPFVESTGLQGVSAEPVDPVNDAILDFLRVSLASIFILWKPYRT